MEVPRPTSDSDDTRHGSSAYAPRPVLAGTGCRLVISGTEFPQPLIRRCYFLAEIKFQPSASLPVGQLVCITQEYEPTKGGTARVGPALAVGRMVISSDLVEGGKKGKALTLLHAWKDQLWEMGGGEKPPRPQLLQGNLNKVDDAYGERIGERSEADVKTQSKMIENGDSSKGLSREGVFLEGA